MTTKPSRGIAGTMTNAQAHRPCWMFLSQRLPVRMPPKAPSRSSHESRLPDDTDPSAIPAKNEVERSQTRQGVDGPEQPKQYHGWAYLPLESVPSSGQCRQVTYAVFCRPPGMTLSSACPYRSAKRSAITALPRVRQRDWPTVANNWKNGRLWTTMKSKNNAIQARGHGRICFSGTAGLRLRVLLPQLHRPQGPGYPGLPPVPV